MQAGLSRGLAGPVRAHAPAVTVPRLLGPLCPATSPHVSNRVRAQTTSAEDSPLERSDKQAAAASNLHQRRAERLLRRKARQQQALAEAEQQDEPEEEEEEEEDSTGSGRGRSSSSRAESSRSGRSRLRSRLAARRRVPAPITADSSSSSSRTSAGQEEGYGVRIGFGSDDEEEQEDIDGDAIDDLEELLGDAEQEEQEEEGEEQEAADDDEEEAGQGEEEAVPTSVLRAAAQVAGMKGARSAGPADRQQGSQRREPMYLSESNSMYVPVLTDEDLAADPPGHRSGYVAVIGRPNAGKSTLINAFVGQKLSIVTYKPQTTRHRVVGIASEPDYQMILFDTPGIMAEQRSKLDERMMAAVVASIRAAEAIIAVVDAGDKPHEALAMFQPGPDWNGPPMAVLLNKADTVGPEQLAELTDWYKTNCRAEEVYVGSALTSDDSAVVGLKAWAASKMPLGPTLYPKSMVSEQPERFFVSEIIREKIFLNYDLEIPYSSQVQIAEFVERPGSKDFVSATILVERESQVGILVGHKGTRLRRLGSAARRDIEEFLGRPVYLELRVQVVPDWRQQRERLADFGYYDPLYIT